MHVVYEKLWIVNEYPLVHHCCREVPCRQHSNGMYPIVLTKDTNDALPRISVDVIYHTCWMMLMQE